MKKIFAGVVLPTLAAVAVIGSGFSVWFFGENQDKVSTDASIAVENMIRIGELTMKEGESILHLDQTTDVRAYILDENNGYVKSTKNGNHDEKSNYDSTAFGKDSAAKGLYMTSKNAGEFDGHINYQTSGFDKMGDWKFEIITKFKFTGAVRNYIGLKQDATKGTWTVANDTESTTYTFKWGDNVNHMYLPMGTGTSTFDFEYLSYTDQYKTVTGKDEKRGSADEAEIMKTAEPHTHQEYMDMKINIGAASKLSIETVATIVKA